MEDSQLECQLSKPKKRRRRRKRTRKSKKSRFNNYHEVVEGNGGSLESLNLGNLISDSITSTCSNASCNIDTSAPILATPMRKRKRHRTHRSRNKKKRIAGTTVGIDGQSRVRGVHVERGAMITPPAVETVTVSRDIEVMPDSGRRRDCLFEMPDNLTKFFERFTSPVTTAEDLNSGDIFYFQQLVLKSGGPVLEHQKAKLFLRLARPDGAGLVSLLYRSFVNFDERTSLSWMCKEDLLSGEPFIVEFEDLNNVRKLIG